MREDEDLASGLGSGDGGKVANRGTCSMFPLGLRREELAVTLSFLAWTSDGL